MKPNETEWNRMKPNETEWNHYYLRDFLFRASLANEFLSEIHVRVFTLLLYTYYQYERTNEGI